jgi:undecaprenyl diphosphate synthase
MTQASTPNHVAIIMDGNRRWAKQKNLPAIMGHKKVVEERIEELIEHAGKRHIPFLTFWAFSTENWNRQADEVGGIMNLFRWAFAHRAQKLIEKGARLHIIGDISKFDDDIKQNIMKWTQKSQKNSAITVTFALNYGGRDEMLRAINSLPKDQIITEEIFSQHLDTAPLPDPDLIIRTSGEQRLSGFLPWQSVYSEFYFTDTLMPDFDAQAFDKALKEYATRHRRHGK